MKRYDYKTTDKPSRAADHWVEKWVCGLTGKGLRIAASLWQPTPVTVKYLPNGSNVPRWFFYFYQECMAQMQDLGKSTINRELIQAKTSYNNMVKAGVHEGEAAVIALDGRVNGPIKDPDRFYPELLAENMEHGLTIDGLQILCKLPLPHLDSRNLEFGTLYPRYTVVSRRLPNWYLKAVKTIDFDLVTRDY